MIIEFSVTNFRSIKERQTLSMLPSNRVKDRRNSLHSVDNYPDLKVLPVAVIFGKNNAGKSNLIRAFKAFEWLVLTSHRFTKGDELKANEVFQLDRKYIDKATTFELDFIAKDKKRYLFIIEFTKDGIQREELHFYNVSPTGKTTTRKLYVRNINEEDISFGEDFKGNRKITPRSNVLFLSKSIQEDDTFLDAVFDFVKSGFYQNDMEQLGYTDFQLRYFGNIIENPDKLSLLNDALRNIDSDILELGLLTRSELPTNISIDDKKVSDLNEDDQRKHEKLLNILKTDVIANHRFFDGLEQDGMVSVALKEESDGTRKFIAAYSALLKTIEDGTVLIIDELERSLHPLLIDALISLMNDIKTNPNGGQLIFTSHYPSILDTMDFDQVNLVEKDRFGATKLYRVSDLRGLRNDVSMTRLYLAGSLDAIPNINTSALHKKIATVYGQE